MTTNTHRLVFLIAICSVVGLGLGAIDSRMKSDRCSTRPTDDCLTQDSGLKLLAGMGQGLVIGTFAAIGASWKVLREDR
jgi:hypothetical protein